MRVAAAIVPFVFVAGVSAQEPVVRKEATWVDVVKRGDMTAGIRAQGVIATNKIAHLKVPEVLARHLELGQSVAVDTSKGVVNGEVSRISPDTIDGKVQVDVSLEGAVPEGVGPGMAVDALLQTGSLSDVLFVGRPAICQPDSECTLFRIEPGGQFATRVKVLLGQYGHKPAKVVEVREGLRPGDKVILSDTSAYADRTRIRLE